MTSLPSVASVGGGSVASSNGALCGDTSSVASSNGGYYSSYFDGGGSSSTTGAAMAMAALSNDEDEAELLFEFCAAAEMHRSAKVRGRRFLFLEFCLFWHLSIVPPIHSLVRRMHT